MAGLTYDYAQATVRLVPLSAQALPGVHDLCLDHMRATTAPRGWTLIRVSVLPEVRPARGSAAMALLAEAVRRAGAGETRPDEDGMAPPDPATVVELAHRGHLRVLVDAERVG